MFTVHSADLMCRRRWIYFDGVPSGASDLGAWIPLRLHASDTTVHRSRFVRCDQSWVFCLAALSDVYRFKATMVTVTLAYCTHVQCPSDEIQCADKTNVYAQAARTTISVRECTPALRIRSTSIRSTYVEARRSKSALQLDQITKAQRLSGRIAVVQMISRAPKRLLTTNVY